jgi:hypothetical protein
MDTAFAQHRCHSLDPKSLAHARKHDGVDVFLVWRDAPTLLADHIEAVARSFEFNVTEISAERRTLYRDADGEMRARSLRRVRLSYYGTQENFCVGLLAVLEEIDGLCRWVHIARLDCALMD